MSVELEGPTALREDLVHALSLSLNVAQISGRGGSGRFCAALSAVWNGKLGSVAVLLHEVDGEAIRRFGIEPWGGVATHEGWGETYIHPRDSGGVLFQFFQELEPHEHHSDE